MTDARKAFLESCREMLSVDQRHSMMSAAFPFPELTREMNMLRRIEKWASECKYFSPDIGYPLLQMALKPQSHATHRLDTVLFYGDSFEENPVTSARPCIDIGGNGDGLFPVLLFRTRQLIVVDPSLDSHVKHEIGFDYGRGIERLTVEYMPRSIRDYVARFRPGSLMTNALDQGVIPEVFKLAKKSLTKGGFFYRSPTANPEYVQSLATARGHDADSLDKPHRLNYIGSNEARKFGLRKLATPGLNCDLYEKIV